VTARLLAAGAVVGGLALLLLAERRWPLRRAVDATWRRRGVNLALGALTGAAMQVALLPLILGVAALVEARGWGLLGLISRAVALPAPAPAAAALVLLDYTFYWWHRLLHVTPALWRFHLVHHTDLDLDVTTSARFHVAEYALGAAFRVAQVVAIGAGPVAAAAFEGIVVAAAGLHHANVRLPLALERRLVRLVVTPRMHGIHHSAVERETNSNWSTVLTLWDRLHGTLRLDVSQADIAIGVPAYRDARALGLRALLALPFIRQRPAWRPPLDRPPSRTPPTHLVA